MSISHLETPILRYPVCSNVECYGDCYDGSSLSLPPARRTSSPGSAMPADCHQPSGRISNPSALALSRIRLSNVSTCNWVTRLRACSAVARCMASSVLIGSCGKGRRARSTTSRSIASTTQCSAVALTWFCRRADSAGERSPAATPLWRTRSHSTRLSSEVSTSDAEARHCRADSPASSPSSHARIALDSA